MQTKPKWTQHNAVAASADAVAQEATTAKAVVKANPTTEAPVDADAAPAPATAAVSIWQFYSSVWKIWLTISPRESNLFSSRCGKTGSNSAWTSVQSCCLDLELVLESVS